ncbi:MAG TPA: AI-2E family transporter, partial [Streptosporangiaceae bacterium]|nr:AI-2E family transporter [Streptosporangiaceae bacterium]
PPGAAAVPPGAAALPPDAAEAFAPGIVDPPDAQVPRLLQQAAAWSWRLLLVAAVTYLAFKVTVALRLLVLPFIVALLLTALLQPLALWLRRHKLPALAATWCTLLAAIVVLAGLGLLIANRVQADFPRLKDEVLASAHTVQVYLSRPPFRLKGIGIEQLSSKLVNYLNQHKGLVEGTVLTGGRIFLETLAGLILTVFITFFLLKDGDRIWAWLVSGLRPVARARANRAGDAAWHVLVSYVRGTTVVAAIHALVIGLALWILGVPLLVPLVILVFLAAYVPLIGVLVVGALAILVTLATKGWIAALVLLAVFLVENQLDSHLLQPQVVGRAVRLHPLGIIVVLAVGGIVAGIPGAIVAVPTTAVISYAWPYLRSDHPPEHVTGRSRAGRWRAGERGRKPGREVAR